MAGELGRDVGGLLIAKDLGSREAAGEGGLQHVPSQLIKVVSDVADRFIFGVTLGLREMSPNSLPPLSLSTWLMAKFLSDVMGLASKESIRRSGWAYHAPFLT